MFFEGKKGLGFCPLGSKRGPYERFEGAAVLLP